MKEKKENKRHDFRADLKRERIIFTNKFAKTISGFSEMFTNNKLWPYLEAVMTMAMVVILAIFAIKPTAFAISSLFGQIKAREKISSQMENKIKNLVAAQNNYFEAEKKADRLDEFYPERENVAKGAAQILGLGVSSSLTVTGFNIQPLKEVKNKQIGFTFSAKGSFGDMVKFLYSLDKVGRAVKINSYSLKPDVDENDKVNTEVIVLSLQGDFGFFYPQRQNETEVKKNRL